MFRLTARRLTLRRTHPWFDHPRPLEALEEDRALYVSARHAADRGVISRRSFLSAATGVGAWLLVAESPAFAKKVAGRKGYAVQGVLDRDQLLGGVLRPESSSAQDTLSAAWGRVRTLRSLELGPGTRLAEAPTEFTSGAEGQLRTKIDHGGIRPHLKSPFDEEESYVPVEGADETFRRHERSAQRRVREILVDHADDSLETHGPEASGTRFVVLVRASRVWCNKVGTVKAGPLKNASGEPLVLPAGTALTFHGRESNSVLVNHPLAAATAGARATFVDARNLVDIATKGRVHVFDRELGETYEPSEGCLRRDIAERLCTEAG